MWIIKTDVRGVKIFNFLLSLPIFLHLLIQICVWHQIFHMAADWAQVPAIVQPLQQQRPMLGF